MKEWIARVARQREFMIFVIVAVVTVAMTFSSPHFLTTGNILALLLGLSIEAIVVVAMTNLMVSGGFDMSVGSVLAFTSATTATFLRMGMPVVFAVLIGLSFGAIIGLINGFFVAKVGLNPFVTTLSGLSLYRGLTLIITGGQNLAGLPRSFRAIGQPRFFGVQTPIIIALVLIILGDLLLRNSRFFRQFYYIGGNEKAARLSGIRVDRLKMLSYVLTGFFAAVAGVVMTSRLGAASVTAGTGMELRVITAVIIGGASLQGGEGSVLGSFLGILLMGLILNALNLLGVSVYWQTFVVGATLLTAVVIDRLGKLKNEGQLVLPRFRFARKTTE
ncbi:MAG: ABC transporter permease [Spirochaetaceae bacterium]|nr:MAG: ABC transporter permease [Spirochaetaceae bacterium]